MPEMLIENSSKYIPPHWFLGELQKFLTGGQGNWVLELTSLISWSNLACISSLFLGFYKLKRTESEPTNLYVALPT